LHNRRALEQRFAHELQHQRSTGRPLTLVLLDIDDFKDVNDRFGHAAGDAVLQTLGRTMTEGLRASDAVFRIGGEEFALLMPDADGPQALQRVQALHQRVAARVGLPGGQAVRFSAGVSSCRDSACTLDELLRRADVALYAAKAAGRNRSVLDPG
jgi:diguanylate cyclase (GGDEF)-like protein